MLERSKMSDLSIDSQLCLYLFRAAPLIKEVLNNHTSRITEITLNISTSEFFTLLEELMQRPPSLRPRELRLRVSWPNRMFPNAILIPDRLRILETERLNFAWEPSQSFPCLTHLTIGPTDLKVSLPDFIPALRGMPALESLHMRNSLPSTSSISYVQPVHLATLRKLNIISEKEASSGISIFLALITLPASTQIVIHCNPPGHRPRLSAFASSLHSLFRNMHSEPEDFKDCYHQSVWVRRSGINDGLELISPGEVEMGNRPRKFELLLDTGYTPEQILWKMFPALLRNEILSLRLGFGLRSKILFQLSDTLPRLRNIVLEGNSMPNFIAVMTLGQDSSLPFQNLRHLTLYRAEFSSRIYGGLEVRELRNCLEKRSKSNAGLEKLKILRCYRVYDKDIHNLREIVDVEWDGIVSKPPRL